MTIKLLHLSDLHVTANDQSNLIVQQRIKTVAARYPDHYFIITGDLIDNEGVVKPGTAVPVTITDPAFWASAFAAPPPPLGPIAPHLEVARAAMQKAFALVSLLPLQRTFVCAGNHDFGLWGNVYAREFEDAFDQILWHPINGNKQVTQLGVLDNALALPAAAARTPIMFTIAEPGVTVQLIMLNTVVDASVGSIGDFASGSVGGEQLGKLQTFLSAELISPIDPTPLRKQLGIVRILALHHHPWDFALIKKLNDADALLALARRTHDLIMFGHKHVQKRFEANSVEAAQFEYGGLAAGWIRSETTAAEIVIENANSVRISYVPIS